MKANRLLTILSISAGIVLCGASLDASAQQYGGTAKGQMNMPGGKMDMPGQAGRTPSVSTQAFKQNAAKMMKDISDVPYTGDPDVDFVAHMIPHHQGAVEQAEVELKYGKDPQMRALAENIIKSQKNEIAYMNQWLAKHNNMPAQAGGTQSASTQAFKENAAKMMKDVSDVPYTGDPDVDFVAHMIPHHQGAVAQAEVELKYGKDPQMKALAENIIKAQKNEIATMQQWLANHSKRR